MPCDDDPVTALFLFDLDGTMVDHRGAALAAITQVVQGATSARLPADELVELWWDLERGHMRYYLDGSARLPSSGDGGSGRSSRCWATRFPVMRDWTPGPPGVTCLLMKPPGPATRCAPVPGGPRRAAGAAGGGPCSPTATPQQQRAKLARFGLLGHFEAVLTSADLGVAKPDPAAFTAACLADGRQSPPCRKRR